jgi:cytochrome c1
MSDYRQKDAASDRRDFFKLVGAAGAACTLPFAGAASSPEKATVPDRHAVQHNASKLPVPRAAGDGYQFSTWKSRPHSKRVRQDVQFVVGYNYSEATKNAGLVWDEPNLERYLRAPRELIPGTRMAFAGLKKSQEVSDVIAYLKQFAADDKQAFAVRAELEVIER